MTYVVHLEDDETLQEILKVAFQATDPKVNLKQFISGDEAAGHIQPNVEAIDLFVLDIRVPGSMDGMGVARKIREWGSDAPIIMTSAYRAPDRDVIDSLSLEWMSKPWHIMEISQRLISLAKKQRAKAAATAPSTAVTPSASVTPSSTAPVSSMTPPPTPVVPPPQQATIQAPSAPLSPASNAPITPTIKPKLPAAPPPPPKPPTSEE